MHHLSKTIDGIEYHVNHNGDWSGRAHIHWRDSENELHELELPGELLQACGRTSAFAEVIAAVEQMD